MGKATSRSDPVGIKIIVDRAERTTLRQLAARPDKTTLALLLLRELLHAGRAIPCPVLLSMSGGSWRRARPEWLARRLSEEYPALRASVFGPDAAPFAGEPAESLAGSGWF